MLSALSWPMRAAKAFEPLHPFSGERLAGDAIATTPKAAVFSDGTATLYRYRPRSSGLAHRTPVLLVPSLINRWYVLDLRAGASVAEHLVEAGHDVFVLDWGIPEDEDRYLTWDDVNARLARMVRRTCRASGAEQVALLGYCIGGTLAAIYTALNPDRVAALVNLAGPIDFSHAGMLRDLVDPSFFDAESMGSAGNVSAEQMQSGFVALRPTGQIGKWVTLADRAHDPLRRKAFHVLEAWASDNIPFPGEAYVTFITELYQRNALVSRTHYVAGRLVDLSKIECPILSVGASNDAICPFAAAEALNECSGSSDTDTLVVPGGHVGAVVGSKAAKVLYPKMSEWLAAKIDGASPAPKPRRMKKAS